MVEGDELKHALATIRLASHQGILARRVPLYDLVNPPLTFLLTTGKAGRFNPPGLQCLYLSGNEETAMAEYERNLGEFYGEITRDVATFWVEYKCAHVLDLCDAETCSALELEEALLFEKWRCAGGNACTQILGFQAFASAKIAMIRYPSIAAREKGFEGSNMVVFKEKLKKPDFLVKRGPRNVVIEQWPDK